MTRIDVHDPIDKILAEAEARFDAHICELGATPTQSDAQVWRAMGGWERIDRMLTSVMESLAQSVTSAYSLLTKGTP